MVRNLIVVVLPKKGAGSYTCFACCQERENQQSGSQSEPHYHCRPPRFTAGGVWLNDTRPPGRRISAARGSMRLMGAVSFSSFAGCTARCGSVQSLVHKL